MSQIRALNAACFLIVGVVICGSPAEAEPRPEHGLRYTEPTLVWDEAMPLGNGLLGALVWGDGKPLRISLDRTDLWDLRPVPEFQTQEYSYKMMRQWVKEGRIEDLHRLYDKPYGNPGPTKIPAGRIELTFDDDAKFQTASLDIAKAIAETRLSDGTVARVLSTRRSPWALFMSPASLPESC